MTHIVKVVRSEDGRRWADLTGPQLVGLVLGSARPKTMAGINAKAKAWAQAQGYDGFVGWTIADLVDAGLAVKALASRRRKTRAGGFTTVGRFRWLAEDGRLL